VLFQLRRSCGVDQQPHAAAALRCWTRTRLLTDKQKNEFAAHNRYPALYKPLQDRYFTCDEKASYRHAR
jgi:hypothetical protein